MRKANPCEAEQPPKEESPDMKRNPMNQLSKTLSSRPKRSEVEGPAVTRQRSNARALFLLAATLVLSACDDKSQPTPKPDQAPPTAAAEPAPPNFPPDTGPAPSIDADRTMQVVKDVVKFGARPIGSANHVKLEKYILDHLQGDDVESDSFVVDTPVGKLPVHNIIAKYRGTKDGIIVIAGHYDTNYPLRDTAYVGANDGGSTTAILLELAHQLRGKKRDGYSVWLVWTDAEEAIVHWTDTDSVYGTRHLAEKWQADGTAKQIKAFILEDMIGDADLDVAKDGNSTPWLEQTLYEAATRLGNQSHFFAYSTTISDDHVPFRNIGVPVVDIIDIDYGYHDVFHHTPQDTVDKLSTNSLQIIGSTTLEMVRMIDKMDPLPK
jgi:glutaminyl-peptide cyclotransferase